MDREPMPSEECHLSDDMDIGTVFCSEVSGEFFLVSLNGRYTFACRNPYATSDYGRVVDRAGSPTRRAR